MNTSPWFDLFSFSKETRVISDISDHLRILLKTKTCKGFKFRKKKRLHYEKMWQMHSGYKEIIEIACSGAASGFPEVTTKIKN